MSKTTHNITLDFSFEDDFLDGVNFDAAHLAMWMNHFPDRITTVVTDDHNHLTIKLDGYDPTYTPLYMWRVER